jgi:hypothetical protein
MNKYDWTSNKKIKLLSTIENDESNTNDNDSSSTNNSNSISAFSNHIYFNDDINYNTAFKLNNALRLMETKLKSLNIDIIDSERELLNGLELDIYIPSHNLAIEFNGLYWHNELHKDKKYHLNKTELCEAKGIQLIHVFEDEWMFTTVHQVSSLFLFSCSIFDNF